MINYFFFVYFRVKNYSQNIFSALCEKTFIWNHLHPANNNIEKKINENIFLTLKYIWQEIQRVLQFKALIVGLFATVDAYSLASRCQAFAVISLSSGLSSGGHIRRGTLKAVTYLLTGELWFSGPRDQGFGVGPLQYFKVTSRACMRCLHQTRPSSNPVDNCHFSFWSECTTVSNHWFFVELILESYEI